MPDVTSDDAATNEVFAAYGRAMHGAQTLEFWLRILVTVNRTVSKTFSSEGELERAVETLSTSTMGTVVSALRSLVHDPELEAQLARAVTERNRLAHKFFGEWADIWNGSETDARMIQDANRVRNIFDEAVRNLTSTIGTHLATIGSNPDEFIPGLNQRIADVQTGDRAPLGHV
ncbi:hypothetical protein FB472_0386 [Rhodoglobus vestalii]|uniref:Uncharacterized protein n=1 Tax=Rhodoglobus vestalii TaxID=193384 RepID=A0A8H2K534_9MICO|nr:hypothetical protein [Rhodoglobus vestalii]TQO18859.1 hypothetical protein FB472_0386 [Rhodoglobus vestalii]